MKILENGETVGILGLHLCSKSLNLSGPYLGRGFEQ